jgi:transposase-like protein
MDISKVIVGEVIEGFKCSRCKDKNVRRTGKQNEKSYLECHSCFLSEWVDTKNAKFTYEPPKEPKRKKDSKEDDE